MGEHDGMPVRDPRYAAPVLYMDLSRSTETINADLRSRYPRSLGMWWELETDERSGWVYNGDDSILTKLVHEPS